MEYEPKIIPEGINTAREHPLREFAVLVFGLALVIVVVTGLLAVSMDFLIRYIPLDKENEWFSSEMLTGNNVEAPNTGTPLEAEVEQHLQRLIEQLQQEEKPGYRFTVTLLHDEVPNAFVIPGGHIFVTAGLLDSVESENGLAMVLAHEMGHQYHRHPLRSLGRGIVISLALMAISGTDSGGLVESFVVDTATLTNLGFSREQEREADLLGVDLLIRHYGHANGSSEFFETINKQPKAASEVPGFLSTHPGIDERIAMLRDHIGQVSYPTIPLPGVIGQYLDSTAIKHQ